VTVSRYTPQLSRPLHFLCLPQSIPAPIDVAPKTLASVRHILATSFDYFALSAASPIHLPIDWAALTLADAHGPSLHAPSLYTLPGWHRFAVSVPVLVSRLPLSISAFGTLLSTLCDTLDLIRSALFFDSSFLYYTYSRLKTACLKGRGFYPIYRQ